MSSDDARDDRASPHVTSFFIVRHAESVANAGGYFGSQSDSPLSPLGEAQAASLARALSKARIDAIYASDLSRARRTIEAIAAQRALPIHETALLRERSMGELTGMTFADAAAKHPEVWTRLLARDPHVAPPGGETHVELAARVTRFLAEASALHRGRTVLVASHGGTIHHLVRQLLGVHDLALTFAMHVENASVSRVDLLARPGEPIVPRLLYVNRVAFDGPDLIER